MNTLSAKTTVRPPCTMSRARFDAVPATLTAEHWYQAASVGAALSIVSRDAPSVVSTRYRLSYDADSIRPSFCQLIIGVGAPSARTHSATGSPSRTDTFDMRSVKRGAHAAVRPAGGRGRRWEEGTRGGGGGQEHDGQKQTAEVKLKSISESTYVYQLQIQDGFI